MMASFYKKKSISFSLYSIRKGFTLIELLVVIGILGILVITLLATINPIAQLQKANDAHRKSDLESIQRALELYYQDKGTYPPSSGNFKILSGTTTIAWVVLGSHIWLLFPKIHYLTIHIYTIHRQLVQDSHIIFMLVYKGG